MAGPGPEELARHQRFLLRLALRLAGPEVEAEDLVQEVYVQALERPPAEQASVRGWLATVLRRSAGRSARGALRRSDREALAARPERAGGEPSIDARIELQSALLAHLRELPAGEREALFLRYADDLTPPEIAARLDVSLETVRTRLRRGRQRLRARLDARPGGRAAWCALLLRAPRAPLSPITGAPAGVGVALLMTTTAKVLLGAAACAAAALFVLRPTRSPREPAALDPGSRGERIATTALATPASELPAPRRADPGESGPAAAVEIELAPARPAASPWPVLVRAEGAPAAGAHVLASARLDVFGRYDAAPVEGRLDSGGELLLDLGAHLAELLEHAAGARPEELVIELDHPDLCPATGSLVLPEEIDLAAPPAEPPTVVVRVETAAIVLGRLVAQGGAPPAGETWVQAHALAGEDVDPAAAGYDVPDASGAFRLRLSGAGPHALFALAERLRPTTVRVELARGSTLDLGDVRLDPGVAIDGRALDRSGSAREGADVFAMLLGSGRLVERARYMLELSQTLAWHDGAFELFVAQAETAADGSFRLVGLGPWRYQLDSLEEGIDAPFPLPGKPEVEAPATVELRPQAAELRLDFLFPEARPRDGAVVWTMGAARCERQLPPWTFQMGLVPRFALPPDATVRARFAFEGLQPLELELDTPGVGGLLERELRFEPDPSMARLVLALRGIPVADGTPFVARIERAEGTLERALATERCALVLGDLRPGELALTLSAGSDRFAPQDHLRDLSLSLDLLPGEERRVELTLERGGTLVLEALDEEGARVPARCTVRDAAGNVLELVFVARIPDGRAAGPGVLFPGGPARAVPELPPGRYRVTVEAAGFAPEELSVAIEAGEVAQRSVALRRAR